MGTRVQGFLNMYSFSKEAAVPGQDSSQPRRCVYSELEILFDGNKQ